MVKLNNGYVPETLDEAVAIMRDEKVKPYSGGTDLMIDGDEDITYLFLNRIPELKIIRSDSNYIRIGAECTFTDIEESAIAPQILKDAISQLAGPAIRNFGTIAGNIGNGSAKADSVLILFVTDSLIRVKSADSERKIYIKDFYKERKQLDLKEGELIVEILIPKKHLESYYYKKVGARKALAISRVCFAGLFHEENGVITHVATAFGAIEPTIVRHPKIDEIFIGKTINEAKVLKDKYLNDYENAINPSAGRVSKEYRKTVCMNILKDFFENNGV
ncbi:xanthine dehydrogenase family protein subunit M [Clostridium sp. CF012]|uniref:FAD binding domain-containing protein n=1 Tax=Clostridium sp. CF012 TaxID=2843319 RepID=UPI001C0CD9C5|nr:FAD binding domain-containing protein [Clostridium sp. CF012]MBU3145391.1 FAD binding domain-containing protein [Clostridium sp. CF012]